MCQASSLPVLVNMSVCSVLCLFVFQASVTSARDAQNIRKLTITSFHSYLTRGLFLNTGNLYKIISENDQGKKKPNTFELILIERFIQVVKIMLFCGTYSALKR